jgi:hypothetical protein
MSAVVRFLFSRRRHKIHTFVREVVTQAEDKLRRFSWLIAIVQNKPLRNFAFVDEARTNFKVGFASHNLNVVLLSHRPLQLLLALASLVGAVLWIRSPIMPCKSNLLALNERTWAYVNTGVSTASRRGLTLCFLSVLLEDIDNLGLPAHVGGLG